MTNLSETNLDQSTDDSKESLTDVLYQALGLPEIQGSQLANAHLLRQLILVLAQSGIISAEHFEQILARTETAISEFTQNLSTDADEQKSEVVGRIKSSALKQVERSREFLKLLDEQG